MRMTKADYERHVTRIEEMERVDRKKLLDEISDAKRQESDLNENGAYVNAMNSLKVLDHTIRSAREMLLKAEIVETASCTSEIGIGSIVEVIEEGDSEVLVLEVVSDGSSDPLQNKVSIGSPIIKGCAASKIGETIEIVVDNKVSRYHFKAIKLVQGLFFDKVEQAAQLTLAQ